MEKGNSKFIDSGFFVNNNWIKKNDKIDVFNPYNNEKIGSVANCSIEDVDNVIRASLNAFKTFKNSPSYVRANILRNIANKLREKKEDIAKTITLESGKAIRFSRIEVDRAIETFNFAADEAETLCGETIPMDAAKGGEGRIGFYLRVPLGVAAGITPFNFPLNLPAHKIAPAIAAGDTIVWKPSSLTPLTAVLFGEIIEEINVPKGLINIVFGEGEKIGEYLASHPDIKILSFTGSVPVGEKLHSLAGMKRVLLELGSNSAMIIDESAKNMDEIVSKSVVGSFANAGQICISIQRIYVHKSLFNEFCERFVESSKNVKVGNPFDEDVLYGPMITESKAKEVEEIVYKCISDGAKPLLLGKREGSIIYPTILTDVTPEMEVVSKEIFAPVVSVMPFNTFEEAIELVNSSDYGLNVGIYTENIHNILYAIKECEIGSIIVNDYPTFRIDNMPYGGVKKSGIGREGPHFAIDEYTEIKFVSFK
uniref:Aldehyde dehydrogenase family protein n=1 Tax=candidate division WOR-3 bacterium TaxID=2052148 RepID=A0A7C4YG72_UNCW3